MLKKIVAALFAALFSLAAFAAVDANKATQAELEAIKGIGPVISSLIVSERKNGPYKDWNDLVGRVKGVGDRSAAKFSEGGLTVNGAAYVGTAPAEKAPMTARAASATRATAARAASAVKTGGEKAASATMAAGRTVKDSVKEQKDAAKENVQESRDRRAAAKAEKAEKAEKKAEAKAEKSAAAASAAKK